MGFQYEKSYRVLRQICQTQLRNRCEDLGQIFGISVIWFYNNWNHIVSVLWWHSRTPPKEVFWLIASKVQGAVSSDEEDVVAIATHTGRGLLKTMRTGEGEGEGRGQGEVELAVYRSSFSKSKPVLRTLYLGMSTSPFQGWCPAIRSPPAKLHLTKLFPRKVSRVQSCVGMGNDRAQQRFFRKTK